jgi:hypothetical protein
MAAKKSAAPKLKPAKTSAALKATVSTQAPSELRSAKRAAAVESNLGETQTLRDFLSGAGWD